MTADIPQMNVLHTMRARIKLLKETIAMETAAFEEAISDLRDELNTAERDFQTLAKARFEADNPLDGKYLVIETHRTTRTVNPVRFRDAYPILFAEIATVPVKAAEEAIGKSNLDPLCDLKVSESKYDLGVVVKTVVKAPVDKSAEPEEEKPIFHCQGTPY